MKIIENFLTIWGLISFIYMVLVFFNKKCFKRLIEFKQIINEIKKKRPIDRSSGIPIDLHIISGVDLNNLINRYTKEDISYYIRQLEDIKHSYILEKYYYIDNLINKLYEMENKLSINDDFNIKFFCHMISTIISSNITNDNILIKIKNRFIGYYKKQIGMFRAYMFKKTNNTKWILK